jgi:hypothetical protein
MEFEIATDDESSSETTDAVSPGTCLVCVPFGGCMFTGD